MGRVVRKHRRRIGRPNPNGKLPKFVIALADRSDPSVAEYHDRVQPLARWFIEVGDGVETGDDARGAWEVMYLFRDSGTPPRPPGVPCWNWSGTRPYTACLVDASS